MVGFLLSGIYTFTRRHPFGMAKNSDIGQRELVIREKKILSKLPTVGCTPHPRLLERMFSSGSTTEPERFGKVRPLGFKGSNPLQGL